MNDCYTFRNLIGGSIIGGFLGSMGALYAVPVPADNHDLIVFMLGQLSGFAGGVVAFHYGSSSGSQRKTDVLMRRMEDASPLSERLSSAPPPQQGG